MHKLQAVLFHSRVRIGHIFFALFCHQVLQEGHELVLAHRGQTVVAHHQVGLRRAVQAGIIFPEKLACSCAKILSKELDLFYRWDTPSALHFVYQIYTSATFAARNRWLHAFCYTVFFDVLHKKLFVQGKYHLFCNCRNPQNYPIAE